MNQTVAVTDPLSVVPGYGKLAKPVKDCTELSLGGRGLQQLAGFERLVNLEVLWLHDNQLRCINNLDANVRIRQLYAHNNRLCTLKGSLAQLKFLTHLDVSHNQLKALDKVLASLQKLRCLQELNLQGNPCCEEPQYRLTVLAALPTLKVLDHLEVTTQERQQAARLTSSGQFKPLTVAFGTHIPNQQQACKQASQPLGSASQVQGLATAGQLEPLQQGNSQKQQQQQQGATQKQQWWQRYSVLELELAQEVAAIRLRQQQAAAAAEEALYADNPHAAYWEPRSTLPPNPALMQAQQAWAATTAAATAAAAGANSNSNVAGSSGSSGTCSNVTAAAAHMEELAARGCLPGTFSYRPTVALRC